MSIMIAAALLIYTLITGTLLGKLTALFIAVAWLVLRSERSFRPAFFMRQECNMRGKNREKAQLNQ
jgi:hypothetical protein